jgi:hypothetical protein
MTPTTDVVPLAVVPRELLVRCLDATRTAVLLTDMVAEKLGGVGLSPMDPLYLLAADLEAALAAAGGREGQGHG